MILLYTVSIHSYSKNFIVMNCNESYISINYTTTQQKSLLHQKFFYAFNFVRYVSFDVYTFQGNDLYLRVKPKEKKTPLTSLWLW